MRWEIGLALCKEWVPINRRREFAETLKLVNRRLYSNGLRALTDKFGLESKLKSRVLGGARALCRAISREFEGNFETASTQDMTFNLVCDNSKNAEQCGKESVLGSNNSLTDCENVTQHLQENVPREENEMFFKLEGLEPGETFTFVSSSLYSLEDDLPNETSSDEHYFGKPPKKPGGLYLLDKAVSGEYILGRPPKNMEGHGCLIS